jgi:hypothetical protein
MNRAAVLVASVGVLCLTVSVPARADPIQITGGFLDFNRDLAIGPAVRSGHLSVVGNRGFSAEGFVSSTETTVALAAFQIPAGSTRSIAVSTGGFGLSGGRATLDGKTFTDLNGLGSTDQLRINLTGTIDIPAWRDAPVTITAPFGVTGDFQYLDVPSSSFFDVPIRGGGTLTLNLAPEPGGTWASDSFRYDFAATPTPEPATFTLVAGALVALGARTRRR